MTKTLFQPLSGNEMPRFGGPATFMRLPACTLEDALDVGFVGVPLDIATTDSRRIKDASAIQHGDSCRAFRQPADC